MDKVDEMDEIVASNVYNAPITVVHAKLERISDNSIFRSVCPACTKGTLLVRRDHTTFKLIAEDNCILCGQQFVYSDIDNLKKKAGEQNEAGRNAGKKGRG